MMLVFLFSCGKTLPVTKPADALSRISWWRAEKPTDDLVFKDMAAAVRRSLEYYETLPPETVFFFGPEKISSFDLIMTLRNFLLIIENDSLPYQQKIDLIKKSFTAYRVAGSNGRGKMLVTGYYEPVISCRNMPDATFKYPLYKRPNDIIEVDLSLFGIDAPRNKILGRMENKKVVPYYSREEIDQKRMLAEKKLEILWCSDLMDIHVLQVQGSGKADLGDGRIVSVLYNGQNGRQYRSIGKYLLEEGIIPKEAMSLQAIRDYVKNNPDKLIDVLNKNPSYVFFRLDDGPSLGSLSVPLTPGRSIATDNRLLPKGALGFLVSYKPVIENGSIKSWEPFTRFVMNQDTGGAIKGPGRVDLFWGQGQEAELSAGHLQHEGELYFLLWKKD